jgi:DNA-binding LacI/PurR family transcriptional regulator
MAPPELHLDRTSPVPLYRQIYLQVREWIRGGEVATGACLPSIRVIQKQQGVAPESIKRALDDLAAVGLVRKVQGKGVFVSPPAPVSRFWGVVVPFYAEFYNNMIVELRRVAERSGALIEHACDYDSGDRQLEIVRDFAWRGAEAILVVPTRDEPRTLAPLLKEARTRPVVLLDRTSIASQLPYVVQDYILGVQMLVQGLAGAGARRIGYVRDPLWAAGNLTYQTMEQAYEQACEDMPERYIRVWNSPYDLSPAELTHPTFDGLLCVSDSIACIATGLLRDHGVDVPQQVQVAGYNNSDVGRFFTPQITTTDPDLEFMCMLVAQILHRYENREPVEDMQYVIIPRVVERGTSRRTKSEG